MGRQPSTFVGLWPRSIEKHSMAPMGSGPGPGRGGGGGSGRALVLVFVDTVICWRTTPGKVRGWVFGTSSAASFAGG